MRLSGQVFIGIVLLAGATAAMARFVPGADAALIKAGVPEKLVSSLAGSADKPAGGPANSGGQKAGGRKSGPVAARIAVVTTGVVNDRLQAIGDGEAEKSVTVMPQAAGTISEIRIVSGARVEAGAEIAHLEDANERIAVESAKLAFASAQDKAARYKGLRATVTKVELDDAQRAADEARFALAAAELNLSRKIITAPISGIAGIVAVGAGDNVTAQTPVVSIDDREQILVDFWAPERFAGAIMVNAPVEVAAIARPGQLYAGTISAIDNRIDTASRTIRVRARVPNDKDELRPGMSFSVTMKFAGETHPAVEPLSIQWDSKGSYVWRVKDGKAERAAVRIIQRNPENVLVDGDLAAGDEVVAEGMQRMRPGVEVGSAKGGGGAS